MFFLTLRFCPTGTLVLKLTNYKSFRKKTKTRDKQNTHTHKNQKSDFQFKSIVRECRFQSRVDGLNQKTVKVFRHKLFKGFRTLILKFTREAIFIFRAVHSAIYHQNAGIRVLHCPKNITVKKMQKLCNQ